MFGRRDRRYEFEASGEEDHGVARAIALVVAGIGIGSGLALLLSPSSGEELRHTLGRRYRKTIRRLGRHTEDLRDRAEDIFDRATDLRDRGAKLLAFRRRNEIERRAIRKLEKRFREA